MSLPKTIKIGGITYEIIEKDLSAYDADGQYRMGNQYDSKALIEIREEMPDQKKEQTLIHEMTHAMFSEMGIEDDEYLVNRIGLILYQVLKDNDFHWIQSESIESVTYQEKGSINITKAL